jgi:hypothetical protein
MGELPCGNCGHRLSEHPPDAPCCDKCSGWILVSDAALCAQARREALEDAAKVAEGFIGTTPGVLDTGEIHRSGTAGNIASAIRALAAREDGT